MDKVKEIIIAFEKENNSANVPNVVEIDVESYKINDEFIVADVTYVYFSGDPEAMLGMDGVKVTIEYPKSLID